MLGKRLPGPRAPASASLWPAPAGPAPLLLGATLWLLSGWSGLAGAAPASGAGKVIHAFDFSGQPGVPTHKWLEEQDFLLKHHATDGDKIELYHAEEALHVKIKKPAFGLVIHEQDIPGAAHVRLHWGVSRYPDGASYEHGIDDEAIMVYVFFGHEKFSSGSMFIPKSPYFIGFYLCQAGSDRTEKPYVGHHFQKTGRYICVDHPGEGNMALTQLDLHEEFRKSFGLDAAPTVSGISIEVDTTESKNDGRAAAFLRRIEFLE